MNKPTRMHWEIRYMGDFGRSLYGVYQDYQDAKDAMDAFVARCRGELKRVGASAELVKTHSR